MTSLQVTLGSSATPIYSSTTRKYYASFLQIQNNAGHNCAYGGANVTLSTGIVIASGSPGGSSTMQFNFPRGACLNNLYLVGTQGDLITVAYEDAE